MGLGSLTPWPHGSLAPWLLDWSWAEVLDFAAPQISDPHPLGLWSLGSLTLTPLAFGCSDLMTLSPWPLAPRLRGSLAPESREASRITVWSHVFRVQE